jgi:pilus assembly protein Flp/PilA
MSEEKKARRKRMFSVYLKDTSGATAVEYGLLVALLGLAIATTLTTVGNPVRLAFEMVWGGLQSI